VAEIAVGVDFCRCALAILPRPMAGAHLEAVVSRPAGVLAISPPPVAMFAGATPFAPSLTPPTSPSPWHVRWDKVTLAQAFTTMRVTPPV
jgi:hypothetical protein